MTPTGIVTVLHGFDGGADSAYPNNLILATDGLVYGTTYEGGTADAGTAFSMTTGGSLTILRTFSASTDGSMAQAPLIQAASAGPIGQM